MPLPKTGYLTATCDNPDASLTDFTLIYDLSNAPAAWWAAVNTSDGTRGRVYKADGTELACDWIDFDNVGETGLLRVKWSGSLAATGTQTIHIYSPNTANSAVAASATYGSDNAYASHWQQYTPSGGVTDRTANGNDMTGDGGVGDGDSTGPIGKATTYDGVGDHYLAPLLETDADATILLWAKPVSATTAQFTYDAISGAGSGAQGRITGAGTFRCDLDDGTTNQVTAGSATLSDATWAHLGQRIDDSNTTQSSFINSVETDSDVYSLGDTSGSAANLTIGGDTANNFLFAGDIAEVQLHTTALSDEWIKHEYDQVNDNAAFWASEQWFAGVDEDRRGIQQINYPSIVGD